MPVLQIFAPSCEDVAERLTAACLVVADALGLQAGDVVATFVEVGRTVVPILGSDAAGPENATRSWPVAVMHGSPRTEDRMLAARDRLQAVLGDWPGADGDAWVTWQLQR